MGGQEDAIRFLTERDPVTVHGETLRRQNECSLRALKACSSNSTIGDSSMSGESAYMSDSIESNMAESAEVSFVCSLCHGGGTFAILGACPLCVASVESNRN